MRPDPIREYDDAKLCLNIEDEINGFEVDAYCSPESIGMTYAGEQPVQNDDGELFDAPFQVDIVLDEGTAITQTEDRELRKELGPRFSDEMSGVAGEVYQKVEESDDPLDTIMEMGADDLTAQVSDDA